MNFNYSYRAFLIASLLTGILVLFLYSVKLSEVRVEANIETYDVVIASEELLPEDLAIAEITPEKVKIETNRAYNEAEKFIASVENENLEETETTESKLQAMSEAMENSKNSDNGISTTIMPKEKKEKTTTVSNSESNKNKEAVAKSGNRNTTISYQLVNRSDIDLPNPVYTCYGSGKVVINIAVDERGNVTKNSYNRNASTTSNECLIDAALEYSSQARFTADATKPQQLGTITFHFPGQQ